MKKNRLILSGLAISLLFPSLALAECTSVGEFTRWSLEGSNTVVLYAGPDSLVRFDVQDCEIQPTSKIEMTKSDLCDGDEILIDGSKCTVMGVYPVWRH